MPDVSTVPFVPAGDDVCAPESLEFPEDAEDAEDAAFSPPETSNGMNPGVT